ncbi:MAG: hypothetical protein K5945_03440 [Bacteroidaceae bacterium]|nr:hypothetical protein [Bacteroidaceae bacterium]
MRSNGLRAFALLCVIWLTNGGATLRAQGVNPEPSADTQWTTDTLVLDSVALEHIADSLLLRLQHRTKDEAFRPDPVRATWLALVFPGGGQIYNRKYWKLPVVYGGFLGCTYALTWNNTMLHDYQQAYLDIMDSDPSTKSYEKMLPIGYDISGKEERFKNIFKHKKNHFRKYRDMSIFAFVGVYLISVIDAYVDAELSSFDISQDLSLRLEPTAIRQGWGHGGHEHTSLGLQCSLTF